MVNKIVKVLLSTLALTSVTYAQQAPQGIPPANNTNAQASAAWYRGGNTATTPNNIFGTLAGFNSPIYTQTFGVTRTKLNGSVSYPVNTFTGVRDGFLLLGNNGNVNGGTLLSANRGAFTLLHLNGNTNNVNNVQEFGYRNWMRTGITFTDNNDRAYIGYRANALDVSDFIVNWSDNSVGGVGAPDNMIINFLS